MEIEKLDASPDFTVADGALLQGITMLLLTLFLQALDIFLSEGC